MSQYLVSRRSVEAQNDRTALSALARVLTVRFRLLLELGFGFDFHMQKHIALIEGFLCNTLKILEADINRAQSSFRQITNCVEKLCTRESTGKFSNLYELRVPVSLNLRFVATSVYVYSVPSLTRTVWYLHTVPCRN